MYWFKFARNVYEVLAARSRTKNQVLFADHSSVVFCGRDPTVPLFEDQSIEKSWWSIFHQKLIRNFAICFIPQMVVMYVHSVVLYGMFDEFEIPYESFLWNLFSW